MSQYPSMPVWSRLAIPVLLPLGQSTSKTLPLKASSPPSSLHLCLHPATRRHKLGRFLTAPAGGVNGRSSAAHGRRGRAALGKVAAVVLDGPVAVGVELFAHHLTLRTEA